ncbi:PsiF family protein [Methylocystis sp.]|uniref:PsiF family protein n=1 Tax=Methylocystis sp. TaxID=1911079 RepID=UPI0027360022|nr:PsiF family protein [Methylocystis sp.]
MFTSMKNIAAGVICASLSFGAAALAEPKASVATTAPTAWAPPAEIAPKSAAPSDASAGAEAPAAAAQPTSAAPARTHAEREKDCRTQADAKGLHGKERKHFKSDCLKG